MIYAKEVGKKSQDLDFCLDLTYIKKVQGK